MFTRSNKALLGAAITLVASVAVVAPAAAASAIPQYRHYVALGDSFTAGPLIPWQHLSWCFRSNNNYPAWLATDLGIYDTPGGFTDASCSSADTTNMTQAQPVPTADLHFATAEPQFDALTLDTDLVTIGIGGNDYSVFGSLIATCPTVRDSDPTGAPCQKHFTIDGTDTLKAATVHTGRNVENVIKGVRERSPAAKIVVVGYPRLVPPSGYCPDVIPFADGDYAWADSVERSLNSALAGAARRQRVTYVDTYGPSLGHDACAGSAAWVLGQNTNLLAGAAYHPNAAGMRAEASLVLKALGLPETADSNKKARSRPADAADPTQLARMAAIAPDHS